MQYKKEDTSLEISFLPFLKFTVSTLIKQKEMQRKNWWGNNGAQCNIG